MATTDAHEARGIKNAEVRHRERIEGLTTEAHVYRKNERNPRRRRDTETGEVAEISRNTKEDSAEVRWLDKGLGALSSANEKRFKDEGSSYEKRLTGPFFWFVLFLAFVKDVLDILFTLTVVFSFFSWIFTLPLLLVILFYLKYNQVPFTTRKVVTVCVTFILEFTPLLGLLPLSVLSLVLIRIVENNERLSKLAQSGAVLFR